MPGRLDMPKALRTLALKLLSFSAIGLRKKPRKVLLSRFLSCSKLAARGRKELFRSLAPDKLETKEAALPSGILTLLLKNVSQDITKDTLDTQSTYSEYILKLVSHNFLLACSTSQVDLLLNLLVSFQEQDIQRKPYSRAHQEKLNNVRQEVYCILECLASQSQVINDLDTSLQSPSRSAATMDARRELGLLRHCSIVIDYKRTYFERLERHARDLASFNLVRIESSKDRQEAAIFVFTVVTIIFLPLSFVSSFFGMNVNDIRNMGRSQWVFWASALPLTAIVAGIALLVAYKIEPVKDFWSGIAERWKGKDAPAESYPAPAPVIRQASYYRPHVAEYGRHQNTWHPEEEGYAFRRRASSPSPGTKAQVIGAGLSRAGTASFSRACETLRDGSIYHGGTHATLGSQSRSQNLGEIALALASPK
ncbi:MAG: hypothetical protein LQ350_008394 [Teloschistes chrysophthalmus]|nr:MAG: hypothetical protein LQ350_008394 [Niorma chrysophthalma]